MEVWVKTVLSGAEGTREAWGDVEKGIGDKLTRGSFASGPLVSIVLVTPGQGLALLKGVWFPAH